jgi:Tfp pilus assembly protein PilP
MKKKHILLAVALFLSVSCIAFADRELYIMETLQILEQLTSQTRKTWIPAGTIEATHEEYRAPKTTDPNEIKNQINEKIQEYQSNPDKRELTENLQKMKLDAIPFNVRNELSNEYTTNSTVSVRFDGDRFYWEINVETRTDSVKPNKDLAGNFMTEQFDLNWNTKRIFAWDGEKYTTYFLPGNHAIIDTTGSTPHVVNGPLTAGFIPWGYGFYSYDNLAVVESAAIEKYVDGQMQIHLTLNNSDGSEMVFVMDPQKDYAVISCSINGAANWFVSKQYSNYQLVSGNWFPATILMERYEAGSNRLLARDLWDITAIDGNVPEAGSFYIEYETDALVEYASYITDKPLMYRYSGMVNTDLLLAERLAFAASEGSQPQNCATAALKYTTSQLGKNVTDQQLTQLVTEPNNNTSLYAMKQFVEDLGLFCRAVKTDIQTLRDLEGCQVILHIPSKHHFVVLAGIDNEYVWSIDLADNRFYYRTDLNFFGMDWIEGAALIISNQPIQLQGNFTEIDDVGLNSIIGSDSMGYKCDLLLQEDGDIFCDYVGGVCLGNYYTFFERWGCEAALAGNCKSSVMIRYAKCPCIEDPYDPFACIGTGEWTTYYMLACK